jgi:hypothetical protein
MKATNLLLAVGVLALTGCASLQERLAKRVGCNPTELTVKDQLHVPAYTEYKFVCEGKNYVCRDAPFVSKCDEDMEKKEQKVEEKAAPAKKDKKG